MTKRDILINRPSNAICKHCERSIIDTAECEICNGYRLYYICKLK